MVMWFDGSLAGWSIWITYFLKVVLAYLTTLLVCAVVGQARIRVRLWGGFLFLSIAAWILLWIPPRGGLIHSRGSSTHISGQTSWHIAVPVEGSWALSASRFAHAAEYLYVFLLSVTVVHLLLKSSQLKRVLRRTQPASPELQRRFRRLCLELNVGRCEFAVVPELRSPATCYWWQSHVLLPEDLVPLLDSDQLDDILRHEIVHVRRNDYFWDRLAALGCRLVFFHPLVWLAYRHLRREREVACDYAVVRESTEARLRYAECLTTLARWLIARRNFSAGISFFSSESLLGVRVRALLTEPSTHSTGLAIARAGFVLIVSGPALLLVSGLGLSLYSPIHFNSLLSQPLNSHVRRKAAGAKHSHPSRLQVQVVETRGVADQSAALQSLNLLLKSEPTSLPVLNWSNATGDDVETSFTGSEDVGSQHSNAVWDEAPAPLARAPKWRALVIDAITGGASLAAGRIDVDDVDGPRKRSR
jgi:beta-lactamase regulating signal transducer with metallopeptidase domain